MGSLCQVFEVAFRCYCDMGWGTILLLLYCIVVAVVDAVRQVLIYRILEISIIHREYSFRLQYPAKLCSAAFSPFTKPVETGRNAGK